MPLCLFEMDNVTKLEEAAETGTADERRLAFVEIGRDTGYAAARSVLDALLRELGFTACYTGIEHPTFVPGRVASFKTDGEIVGILGEIPPEVLTNFNLNYPAVLVELTLHRIS